MNELPTIRRDDFIINITTQLSKLISAELNEPIINIHGIAGIGKTIAIRQLFEDVGERQKYNTVWLGFSQAELNRLRATNMASGAIFPIAQGFSKLEKLIPELAEQLDLPQECRETELFLRSATQPVLTEPLIVLLDGLDDLSIWKWLQESVIKPLLEDKPQTLIICTSQSPLFWDFWELRDQCQVDELSLLSKEQISNFLKQYDFGIHSADTFADTFFDYTLGYPLAVQALVEQLIGEKNTDDDQLVPLPDFSEDELALLDMIGVMRLLEIDMIQKFLHEAEYKPVQLATIFNILTKLRAAQLIRSIRGQPDQITRELRNTVRHRIEARDPGRYRRLCAILAQLYKARADQHPKTAIHACIEWLYYATLNWPAGEEHRLADAYREVLQDFAELLRKAESVNREVINSIEARDPVPADASLVVLFYRDRELIANLKHSGNNVLSDIDEKMQTYLKNIQDMLQDRRVNHNKQNDVTAPYYPSIHAKDLVAAPLRNDFDTICGKVLTQLADRLPVSILPPMLQDEQNFGIAVRTLMIQPPSFDIERLRREVNVSVTISQQQARDILNVFNSRGLLYYDRSERAYTFNYIFKQLVEYTDSRSIAKQPSAATKSLVL